MKKLEITWKGETVTLKEDDVFIVADAIEQVVTLGELVAMNADGSAIRFTVLAKAWAAMLSELGIKVTAREVHREFMAAVRNAEPQEKMQLAGEALSWLVVVLMDGAPAPDPEDDPGNAEAPGS